MTSLGKCYSCRCHPLPHSRSVKRSISRQTRTAAPPIDRTICKHKRRSLIELKQRFSTPNYLDQLDKQSTIGRKNLVQSDWFTMMTQERVKQKLQSCDITHVRLHLNKMVKQFTNLIVQRRDLIRLLSTGDMEQTNQHVHG